MPPWAFHDIPGEVRIEQTLRIETPEFNDVVCIMVKGDILI